MAASTLRLSPAQLGTVRVATNPSGSIEECNRLLQKNHEIYHMFFREMAGMNHISHSLLTCLALGAGPQELQDRYEDEAVNQRPMPPVDNDLLNSLGDANVFYQNMHTKAQYNTFLCFFERKIGALGWKAVVHEFVFARNEVAQRMFSSIFDGLYHPLIHLGLGVEFELPGLVAEALAQAATNDDSDLDRLFRLCDAESENLSVVDTQADRRPQSMLQLVHAIRSSDEIRTAPRWSDLGLKMRNGVVGRAGDPFARIAGAFRIATDEVELASRTAEMISTCAYMCGAAQRAGRKAKIDFFWMHAVTSSIFVSILARQSNWISLVDRVRLVECKVRTDLAWYAASGSPPLDEIYITNYSGLENDSWDELFSAVIREHDDGHAAKFIRALKHGEQVTKELEHSEWADYFPLKNDMWLRLAIMCQNTTKNTDIDLKWVRFTGYDEAWLRPDLTGSTS